MSKLSIRVVGVSALGSNHVKAAAKHSTTLSHEFAHPQAHYCIPAFPEVVVVKEHKVILIASK